MRTTETEHKSAGNFAWFAAKNARMNSLVNASLYTDAQKLKAERAKLALELCYYAKEVHIEFRKTFISVKVEGAQVKDKKNLALLEMCYGNEGIEKAKTKQGVTYRIFRVSKV
jgi:hypothetical protein